MKCKSLLVIGVALLLAAVPAAAGALADDVYQLTYRVVSGVAEPSAEDQEVLTPLVPVAPGVSRPYHEGDPTAGMVDGYVSNLIAFRPADDGTLTDEEFLSLLSETEPRAAWSLVGKATASGTPYTLMELECSEYSEGTITGWVSAEPSEAGLAIVEDDVSYDVKGLRMSGAGRATSIADGQVGVANPGMIGFAWGVTGWPVAQWAPLRWTAIYVTILAPDTAAVGPGRQAPQRPASISATAVMLQPEDDATLVMGKGCTDISEHYITFHVPGADWWADIVSESWCSYAPGPSYRYDGNYWFNPPFCSERMLTSTYDPLVWNWTVPYGTPGYYSVIAKTMGWLTTPVYWWGGDRDVDTNPVYVEEP